jgi:hypothetical protein
MAPRPNVAQLKDIFLKAGVVDALQLKGAEARLTNWGGRLTGVLVEMGLCDEETVVKTLCQAFGLSPVRLGLMKVDPALLARIDVELCEAHGLFPLRLQSRTAYFAVSDPSDIETFDALASKLGVRVQLMVAGESEIRLAIAKHYRGLQRAEPQPNSHAERDAHIAATHGTVFEFDGTTTAPPAEPAVTVEFNDEELARLQAILENRDKIKMITAAIESLLNERGFRLR